MLTPEPTSGVIWNANRGAITLRITVKGKFAHVGCSMRDQCVRADAGSGASLQTLKAEVEKRRTSYRIVPEERAFHPDAGRSRRRRDQFQRGPRSLQLHGGATFQPEEDLQTEKARLFSLLRRLQERGIEMDIEVLQEAYSSGVSEDHPVAGLWQKPSKRWSGSARSSRCVPGFWRPLVRPQGIPRLATAPASWRYPTVRTRLSRSSTLSANAHLCAHAAHLLA